MRVLVCGGRNYRDNYRLARALTELMPSVVIHGACPSGADALANHWAVRNGVAVERYPADWAKRGRGAGPARNARMLADGKPDLVLAFPGGRGTADMVRRARAAGVHVIEIAK